METFHIPSLIAILYVAIFAFSGVYIAAKHQDLNPPWVLILATFWPIYYITSLLIIILEEHDDQRRLHKIKKNNFFDTTIEGEQFLQKKYTERDIKRIRKGRAPKSKKVHV